MFKFTFKAKYLSKRNEHVGVSVGNGISVTPNIFCIPVMASLTLLFSLASMLQSCR